MFGPTASPVVHCQSTWHIGPTTCVFDAAQLRALRERRVVRRLEPLAHRRQLGVDPARERDRLARVGADEARRARDPVVQHVACGSSRPRARRASSTPSGRPRCARAARAPSPSRGRSRRRAPSSVSSYDPSSISTGAAETGITATPTSDSAAPANGSRSTDVTSPSSTPIASRRCSIERASFFRGHRMRRTRLAHMSATLIKGKPHRGAHPRRGGRGGRGDRPHRARHRARRRRPGLGRLHPPQAQGRGRGGHRRRPTCACRRRPARPTCSRRSRS